MLRKEVFDDLFCYFIFYHDTLYVVETIQIEFNHLFDILPNRDGRRAETKIVKVNT